MRVFCWVETRKHEETHNIYIHPQQKTDTNFKKIIFVKEIWVSDPGTGPMGFVVKFCAIWWYLCVRNSDMDPDRTKTDFGTPLPTKTIQKYIRILPGYTISLCICKLLKYVANTHHHGGAARLVSFVAYSTCLHIQQEMKYTS